MHLLTLLQEAVLLQQAFCSVCEYVLASSNRVEDLDQLLLPADLLHKDVKSEGGGKGILPLSFLTEACSCCAVGLLPQGEQGFISARRTAAVLTKWSSCYPIMAREDRLL